MNFNVQWFSSNISNIFVSGKAFKVFSNLLLFKVDLFLWEGQVYPRFTASAHSSALIHQLIIMHARLSQSTSYCFYIN